MQISPKDNSLLEERIKRSGKKPQPAPAAAPATMQPQAKMPAEGKQDGKQKQSRQQQHKQQQRKSPTEEKEVPASDDSKDEETAIPAATKYVVAIVQEYMSNRKCTIRLSID